MSQQATSGVCPLIRTSPKTLPIAAFPAVPSVGHLQSWAMARAGEKSWV